MKLSKIMQRRRNKKMLIEVLEKKDKESQYATYPPIYQLLMRYKSVDYKKLSLKKLVKMVVDRGLM